MHKPNKANKDYNEIIRKDKQEAENEYANRFRIGGKRIGGRRQLGNILERKVQNTLGKQGFMTMDIITKWKQIVGNDLYSITQPKKIKFVRNNRINGILIIKTLSSAHALTISYQEDIILEKVNCFFGYKALDKIQIIHGSLNIDDIPPAKNTVDKVKKLEQYTKDISTSKKLNNIKDDSLRHTLADLYASIKSRK